MTFKKVDGDEHDGLGCDLFTLASVLQDLGAINAINLDGGGSSVTVVNGIVISKPTCFDTAMVCERFVTGITCVK